MPYIGNNVIDVNLLCFYNASFSPFLNVFGFCSIPILLIPTVKNGAVLCYLLGQFFSFNFSIFSCLITHTVKMIPVHPLNNFLRTQPKSLCAVMMTQKPFQVGMSE